VLTPLAHAIEHTTDTVIITDRDGIIEYVNPAFLELTGFAREECIGRKTSLVRSGAQSPRFYDRLWRTILSGRTFHAILTNRRRDGRLYDLEETITPIRNGAGGIGHFIATGQLVTRRRRRPRVRLDSPVEYERRGMARALHADAGQLLALAHLLLADVMPQVAPPIAERLQDVRRHLDAIEAGLRRAAGGRPDRRDTH